MVTSTAPKAQPLNPRQPMVAVKEFPLTRYEVEALALARKTERPTNQIRLLLWWLSAWLPLIAGTFVLAVLAIAASTAASHYC